MISSERSAKRLLPDWALVVFVLGLILVVIVVFAVQFGLEARARNEILGQLSGFTRYRVTVDNRQLADGAVLVEALRGLRHVSAHHSGPMHAVRVEITDGRRSLELILAKDSKRRDEYWVFKPGLDSHGNPVGQQAGRIVDPRLAPYVGTLGRN